MHELQLNGCSPEPLSQYLKALGVLRLVHRVDPTVRGRWEGGSFVLITALNCEQLLGYFATDYAPSPILAAWNGAGGLYLRPTKDPVTKEILAYDKPTTNSQTTASLSESEAARLAPLRRFIGLARRGAALLGLETSPDAATKPRLLQWLRDHADDEVLPWLDATFVFADADTPRYPPLLGTGGNDGALDFANKFQGYVTEIMDLATGAPTEVSSDWLVAALFGQAVPGLLVGTPGQFDAVRAGAANAGVGFGGKSQVNPWDFLLFMEGALVFAGSANKRMEHQGAGSMAFPFTVRSSGAGNGSLTLTDEASGRTRHEVWLPMWNAAASWPEVERVFREGRASVGRRPARDGADFARAAASLGVDRGLTSFVRYGFLQRNGLAYVAAPLGQWSATHVPELQLIDSRLDAWLERLRRVGQDDHAPSSLRRAYRRVNQAVMSLAASATSQVRAQVVQELLCAVGEVDAVVARSGATRDKLRPSPVPRQAADWVRAANDGSTAFRLALALAEAGVRRRLLPLDDRGGWGDAHDPAVVWTGRALVDNLAGWMLRLEVEGEVVSSSSFRGARLDDVAAFVAGEVDETKLTALVRGLAVLGGASLVGGGNQRSWAPSPLWALAALAWDQRRPREGLASRWPTGMLAAGARGDALRMSETALRRLRPGVLGHRVALPSRPPLAGLAVGAQIATPAHARRCVAALSFPLSDAALERVASLVFRFERDPVAVPTVPELT